MSENVRRTLAQMSSGAASSRVRRRRRQDSEEPEDETTDGQVLKVNEFTTVGELASQMDERPTEVITQCLKTRHGGDHQPAPGYGHYHACCR